MKRRWPNASYVEDTEGTAALAQRIFDTKMWREDQPLRVVSDRHGFRGPGLGDAAQNPDGPRCLLFGYRDLDP